MLRLITPAAFNAAAGVINTELYGWRIRMNKKYIIILCSIIAVIIFFVIIYIKDILMSFKQSI